MAKGAREGARVEITPGAPAKCGSGEQVARRLHPPYRMESQNVKDNR